jgi:hypothetical protein
MLGVNDMKWVVFLMMAQAFPVMAEIPANQTSIAGEFNGRFWRTLDFKEKVGFLLGFLEGFSYGYSNAEPIPKEEPLNKNHTLEEFKAKVDKGLTNLVARIQTKTEADPMPDGAFGDIARALDKFYEQPELLPFPIESAMFVLKARFAGKPQAEIDARMDAFRKTYIENPKSLCAKSKLYCDKL